MTELRTSYMRLAVSTVVTLWGVWAAQDVLQPLVIGLFLWILLNATARQYRRVLSPRGLPVAEVASALTFVLLMTAFGLMLSANAAEISDKLPDYEKRLDEIARSASEALGFEQQFRVSDLMDKIELGPTILNLAGSAAGFLSTLLVVFIYMIFVAAEVGRAELKLAALVSNDERRAEITGIADRILREVERYVGLKVILGFIQAVPTWILLEIIGLDAPLFWATVVFLASFIPTVGTLIGVAFPALMALVQFEGFTEALMVIAVLVPIQVLASNWLEPKMMGSSLNLSPLAVIFGIFGGGALWGITGALIVTPLMAVAVIVFAEIPSMRPVAILMSDDALADRRND